MMTATDFDLRKIAPHKYAVEVDGERVGHVARSGWQWLGFVNERQVTSKHELRDHAAYWVAIKANALQHPFGGVGELCRTCKLSCEAGKHYERWALK